MENSVHEEPVKIKTPGIGERVWKRVVGQLDSPEVVKEWDQAILRVAHETRPEYTEEQLKYVRERWHILARSMGVAASVVDLTIAAAAMGQGIRLFATRVGRWTPVKNERVIGHFVQKSPARQRVEHTLLQAARVSPLLGIGGATVALRPARLGLSFAGHIAGVGGENVTRIIRKITHSNVPVDSVYYGSS